MSNIINNESLSKKELGRIKRIETLRARGKYHYPEFKEYDCKLCGNHYSYDINSLTRIPNYYKKGYCCNECYKKSGEKLIDKMITTLNNHNILFNINDISDIKTKYSIYQSNQTKSCVDKWRKTNIKRYGHDYAKKRSDVGWVTTRKKFLILNNLVTEDEYKLLTDELIEKLYITNFNNITKHGESIKQGRMAKYNNDIKLYKLSYKNAIHKTVENYLIKQYGKDYIDSLTDIEYQELFNEGYTYCISIRKKGKKSQELLINWKKAHLINLGINENDINNLSNDEIDKKYSEYISLRMNKLSDTIHNGYKHTKKGWYNFKKYKPFFYRSSWEMKVCEILENKFNNIIDAIITPEPIQYTLNDLIHSYFCDFKIIFDNGKILYIEVKPAKKITIDVNEAKFISAKNTWGENFIVITENEIFSDLLEKKIIDFYNGI